MRLEQRIRKLERVNQGDSMRFAIVGVPCNMEDPFKVAEECWLQESDIHRIEKVVGAVPWPHYSGDEVKFLGVGTGDDVYFGYGGGVHNPETSRFVFLGEVGDLIKSHWQEVQRYMNSTPAQREGLSVSEETIIIMNYMVR